MEDCEILDIFFQRNEDAIAAVESRYGAYCTALAGNILSNPEDVRECVNDTWLRAWNSIPPNRPDKLRLYLGRITRNLALDRWRAKGSRGAEAELSLDELKHCIPSRSDPYKETAARELGIAIDAFLRHCSKTDRRLFVKRYYHLHSIEQVAKSEGITANSAAVRLYRVRKKLQDWLVKEGYL